MFAVAIVFAVCDANAPGSITPRSAITCRRLSPPPKARRRDCPCAASARASQSQTSTALPSDGAHASQRAPSLFSPVSPVLCDSLALDQQSRTALARAVSLTVLRPLALGTSARSQTDTAFPPATRNHPRTRTASKRATCQRRPLLPPLPLPGFAPRAALSTAWPWLHYPVRLVHLVTAVLPSHIRYAHAEPDREGRIRQSPRILLIPSHTLGLETWSCRDTTARVVVASLPSRFVPSVAHAQEACHSPTDHSMKSRLV